MKRSYSTLIFSLLVSLIALAGGCLKATVPPYGATTLDGVQITEDIRHATVPPEAPSISQGFKPGIVSRTEGENEMAEFHYAIDIIEKTGTPILAAASGKVTSSHYDPLYGNRVFVAHTTAVDEQFYSVYNHLDTRLASVGSRVERGQQIGTLGHTGLLSGGLPHLHFEIRNSSKFNKKPEANLNPHLFWFDGAGIVTCFNIDRPYANESFKTTYPVPCLETPWQPDTPKPD